jgi:hypothetical protein
MADCVSRPVSGSRGSVFPAAEWAGEFPADRYRPLLRLLDDGDVRFLRAQQGFRPEMEKRLREQRVRVVRNYLRMMEADFRRVCHGLRRVAPGPGCDPLRLGWILMQQQAAFERELIRVRCGLALYRRGMARVDVAGLMNVFDGMRMALTAMTLLASRVPA